MLSFSLRRLRHFVKCGIEKTNDPPRTSCFEFTADTACPTPGAFKQVVKRKATRNQGCDPCQIACGNNTSDIGTPCKKDVKRSCIRPFHLARTVVKGKSRVKIDTSPPLQRNRLDCMGKTGLVPLG